MKREDDEIDQLALLKVTVEAQDQLLMETTRTIQDLWRILDTAQNPHIFGASRAAWNADRDRAKERLKRLETKMRARYR